MLKAVSIALQDLIKVHQKNPFELLYERDLQSFLFMRLRELIPQKSSITPSLFENHCFLKPGQIETSLVHTEYPSTDKFDVAVIDPDLAFPSIAEYIEYSGEKDQKNEVVWVQRVRVAVEIKQVRIGWPLYYGRKKFKNDLEKLARYNNKHGLLQFAGVAILFIQSCSENLSDSDNMKIYPISLDNVRIIEGISGYIVTPKQCFRIDFLIP